MAARSRSMGVGLHIQDVACTRCEWDDNTNTLTLLNHGKSGVCYATFTFYGRTSGYKLVRFHGENIGSWERWLYINKNANIEAEADEQLVISTNECHKGAESIITVDGKTFNNDSTADFEVLLPNQGTPYKIVANVVIFKYFLYCGYSNSFESITPSIK